MNLRILIEYKLNNSSEWHTVELSTEEYFDMDMIDEDEEISWNCIPEYDHAIEYLDINSSSVSNTSIIISDRESDTNRVIKTTFWNNGQNQIIERIDKCSGISSYLMITNTKLQEEPSVREIMRFSRTNDVLEIKFHSFIRDNEDGSQTEKIIFPND